MPIVCENFVQHATGDLLHCVVVSGIKLRWCLRTEDSECFHKIPLMKDAGERHDFDPNIYLNTFA